MAAPGGSGKDRSVHRAATPYRIAIDGPSAVGKSTVGLEVARQLNCLFLDTGALYRAITWVVLRSSVEIGDGPSLARVARSVKMEVRPIPVDRPDSYVVMVDGEDVTCHLREPEVESAVSLVSRIPELREAQVDIQRGLADHKTVVMAGRDIGTVVLPDAELKVYLNASLDERARRRYEELLPIRSGLKEEEVRLELHRRDQIDSQRSTSPLRPADDAVIIWTDGMAFESVVDRVLELVAVH